MKLNICDWCLDSKERVSLIYLSISEQFLFVKESVDVVYDPETYSVKMMKYNLCEDCYNGLMRLFSKSTMQELYGKK